MKLEASLLDKMVNGAFLAKRHIGRPLKHNIRSKGRLGWLELVFSPRGQFESYISKTLRMIHPYLAYVTYRFHVEKAREAGIRIEDFYMNKFHKEPYIQFHIYAQYFHPDTLLERVRDVNFYRRPRTLFKGFRVPDWATSEQRHGWELDAYSRQAWENALQDMNSEWTPTQFVGERLEPNPLQWFRFEHWGKGLSSRLFYNEVPKPRWIRHGGHLDDVDKNLYSFTHANQEQHLIFGIDTTTQEGRDQFKKEWDDIATMVPELISKDDIIYPHEQVKSVTEEPHFQRVWQFYRHHMFKLRFAQLVEQGNITKDEAQLFSDFVDMHNIPSFNLYIYGKLGQLQHLDGDAGYEACKKVMDKLGLSSIEFSRETAMPYEEQFWAQFDIVMGLSEEQMREELDNFVTDPSNKAKVEALIGGRNAELNQDQSRKISA